MSNILFSNNRNGFTMVANKLLSATNLSLKGKALYAYLMSKPNQWNFSHSRISSEMKEGKDAINNIMNELEQLNLLSRRKMKQDGKWSGVAYYIADIDDSNITHEFKKEKREVPTVPIEERKKVFRQECLVEWTNKPEMSKTLGKRFFEYWTEKTRGKKLMRFELQDTFEISLRMDYFVANEKRFAQEKVDKKENKKKELTTKNT
jgi:predicted transcriptional regulator